MVFFLYTLFIALLVIVGFSVRYILKSKENYYLVVRVYTVVEYSLLAYLFSFYIKNKFIKGVLLFSAFAYFLFCIYEFAIEKVPGMPFVPITVEHILLLIFIIYYFVEIMQDTGIDPIYQKAIFWISAAFIINSAGNFFLFLYSKTSYNNEIFKEHYTIIYTTITVIKNLLLCISILIKEKQENLLQNNLIDIDLDTIHQIKNHN